MGSVYFPTVLKEKNGDVVDFCHVIGAIDITTRKKTKKHFLSVFEKNGMFIVSSMKNKHILTNETLCGAIIDVKDAYVKFSDMFENRYDIAHIAYTIKTEKFEGE